MSILSLKLAQIKQSSGLHLGYSGEMHSDELDAFISLQFISLPIKLNTNLWISVKEYILKQIRFNFNYFAVHVIIIIIIVIIGVCIQLRSKVDFPILVDRFCIAIRRFERNIKICRNPKLVVKFVKKL